MKRIILACLFLAGALGAQSTARAGIIEDFQFNDANGTLLGSAANSANAGNNWLTAATVINASVQSGSYRIQKGGEATPVGGQISNTLETANVTTGKIWLVADIAGWLYTATPSATSERVRFFFLDNDPVAVGSSTITAGINIDRLPNNNLTITGEAGGTGSTATITGGPDMSLLRVTPLKLVLEVDADADTYKISYKDGLLPFVTIGTGNLGERSAGIKREPRSGRFAFTGSYNDTGEFVDVDRIYITNVNPVPEPSVFVLAGIATVGFMACGSRSSMRVPAMM